MGDANTFPYDIRDVLSLCGVNTDKVKGKRWVDVKCPVNPMHDIRVNLEANSFSCFHECSNCPRHPAPGQSGMLDLYCLAHGSKDRTEANREIRDALFGSADFKAKPSQKIEDNTPASEETPLACIEERDKTYRALLLTCPLSRMHAKDLHERGLTDAEIRDGGYKSVPQSGLANICKALQRMGCKLDGVPGFYRDSRTGAMTMASCKPGYFIPYFDQNGLIQGLQIRHDIRITSDMTPEEISELKKNRYRWFSSAWSKRGKVGTGAKNWQFYGLPGTLHKPINGGDYAVYATEGALKANVAANLCRKVYGKERAFVAIAGVSCYAAWEKMCSDLRNLGVTVIVDAFDSDRAEKESVRNSINKLMGIAQDYGFRIIPWNWGTEQKGVDDFLLAKLQGKGGTQ